MIQAISDRRSIRRYTEEKIPKAVIEEIIRAGMLAPSSKNRQPWYFTVVTGSAKEVMAQVMRKGLERERKNPFLTESTAYLSGAEHTLHIMEQAPAVIFVTNRLGEDFTEPLSVEDRVSEICNAQSIGAAIENMTLAATEAGLGSLWICDTFFAQAELEEWLDTKGTLYAALALGYADEKPCARPRKNVEEIVEWRE